MNGEQRSARLTSNEDGLSLVEILIAVTIMAILSVTLMGYFTSAMDKSAEESRRIIAANLARLKAAELRDHYKSGYDESVAAVIASTSAPKYSGNSSQPGGSDLLNNRLNATVINGTTYRYLVELDNSSSRWDATDSFRDRSDQYLAKMLVTVYWSNEESFSPPAKSSTTLDTYIVKGW